jgi:hypothetical protein
MMGFPSCVLADRTLTGLTLASDRLPHRMGCWTVHRYVFRDFQIALMQGT